MASPPRGKGPQEGTPEYDWLYGSGGATSADDATRAIPRQPRDEYRWDQDYNRPDPTRVMPVQPIDPPSGRGAPPGTPHQPVAPSRPGRAPRRRRRFRPIVFVLVVWLLFLVAVPIWAWSRIARVDATPEAARPAEQGGTTYVLVGSDSRGGIEQTGQRADTIMLLHTGSGPNVLLSIPRDSIVSIPGQGDAMKINAAYAYGGPKLLVQTLEAETGIRIDHFVDVGFDGLVGMVDALGGIEICPKEAMQDPEAELDIAPGCQKANGATALGYARSRKISQLGDVDRARAQREVVSAIGSETTSPWTVLNPLRYLRVANASTDSFRISEGTGPLALGRFVLAMTRLGGNSGMTCGVPITDLAVNWDDDRAEQLFSYLRDNNAADIPDSLCTPSGLPQ